MNGKGKASACRQGYNGFRLYSLLKNTKFGNRTIFGNRWETRNRGRIWKTRYWQQRVRK